MVLPCLLCSFLPVHDVRKSCEQRGSDNPRRHANVKCFPRAMVLTRVLRWYRGRRRYNGTGRWYCCPRARTIGIGGGEGRRRRRQRRAGRRQWISRVVEYLKRKWLKSNRPTTTATSLIFPGIGTAAPIVTIRITTVDFRIVSILSCFEMSTFGKERLKTYIPCSHTAEQFK